MMCACTTSVLDAGVLAVLVCFAEDPLPCKQHHPDEFNALMKVWAKYYGDEMEKAGYDRLY